MRKLGIILMIIGSLMMISFTIGLFKHEVTVEILTVALPLLTLGCGLFYWGRCRKKRAKEKGTEYHEMGWGKAIVWFFVTIMSIATIGRVTLFIYQQTIEYQAKQANEACPISIDGGLINITSIKAVDNQVVYTFEYDSTYLSFDRFHSNPEEFKRYCILYSLVPDAKSGSDDNFIKLLLEKKYGIKFIITNPNGKKFEIFVPYDELKLLHKEVRENPTEIVKEILDWQIRDESLTLPLPIDEDMTLTTIYRDSTNLIYKVVVNENLDISDIAASDTKENRIETLKDLYSDIESKGNIQLYSFGEFNLIYRYVDSNNSDSCDIVFSNSEIKYVTSQSNIYKF